MYCLVACELFPDTIVSFVFFVLVAALTAFFEVQIELMFKLTASSCDAYVKMP